MNGYLLDTHVWFWQLTGSPKLSPAAAELIDTSSEELWLSPISVWELGILRQKGRVEIDDDLRSWVEQSRRRLPLQEALPNQEIALATFELDLPHQDPADRFLAATARTHDLTLITADRRLLESASVETFSARR